MKIYRENEEKFEPICIKLETKEDATMLHKILVYHNNTTLSCNLHELNHFADKIIEKLNKELD